MRAAKFYLSDLIIKYYPDFIDVATNNYDYDYVTFPPNLLDASEDEINKFITELVNKEKLENEKRIAEYRLLQLKQKEMQFEELKKELGK